MVSMVNYCYFLQIYVFNCDCWTELPKLSLLLKKCVLKHLKQLYNQCLKLLYELILDHMMWIRHYFMPSFFLSLQHIKRAALQDFNASSAEVICEVGENGFVSISLKMLPIVYDLIFCQTIQYCSQSIHLFYVF